MRIYSIFKAIEGEGSEIGIPKTFIRTVGCPVKCKNCDTPEALDVRQGIEIPVDQIIQKVEEFGLECITITGGEPLIQKNLYLLISLLKKKGYYTTLETSGQLFDKEIFQVTDFLSVDAKTPSTGVECNFKVHEDLLQAPSFNNKLQIKCVVNDRVDFDFVVYYYNRFKKLLKPNQLIITPCWEVEKELNRDFVKKIVKLVLENNLPIRVIIQQHKIIYGPRAKNV